MQMIQQESRIGDHDDGGLAATSTLQLVERGQQREQHRQQQQEHYDVEEDETGSLMVKHADNSSSSSFFRTSFVRSTMARILSSRPKTRKGRFVLLLIVVLVFFALFTKTLHRHHTSSSFPVQGFDEAKPAAHNKDVGAAPKDFESAHTVTEGESTSSHESDNIVTKDVPAQQHSNGPLDKPLAAFEAWKAQHSVEVLLNELQSNSTSQFLNRKFILGTYSCPDEAGNWIHEFTTSVLLAIVTNRTLLWDFEIRQFGNRQACDKILRVAPWIPDAASWRSLARLPFQPVWIESDDTPKDTSGDAARIFSLETSQRNGNSRYIHPHRIYHTTNNPEFWKAGDVLLHQNYTYTFLSQLFGFEDSDYAQMVVQNLYARDVHFLFGMLFNQTMEFTPVIRDSVQSYMMETHKDGSRISIGIHSRHTRIKDNGSNVKNELSCLDGLLEALKKKRGDTDGSATTIDPSSCTVYIMSDRVDAITNLEKGISERNCRSVHVVHEADEIAPVTVNPSLATKWLGRHEEHGPFQGAGYFLDWLVVSQARDGLIYYAERSSSALVYEKMTYDAVQERHRTSDVPIRTPTIARCEIQRHGIQYIWD